MSPAPEISYASASTFQAISSNNYTTQIPNIVWITLVCNTRLTILTMKLDQRWCSSAGLSGDPLAPRPPGGPDPPVISRPEPPWPPDPQIPKPQARLGSTPWKIVAGHPDLLKVRCQPWPPGSEEKLVLSNKTSHK